MYFNYIKKRIVNKRNLILFIIFTFVGLAMMCTTSIGVTILDFTNTLYKNNVDFRTLEISEESDKFDQVAKIKHVESVEDVVFKNPNYSNVKEFDTDLKGQIELKALLKGRNLTVTHGRMIKNENEAICSDVFYPYEPEEINGKMIFNKSRILHPSDIINKTFTVASDDDENKIFEFKIVGTYSFKNNNSSLDSCYIMKEPFRKLASKYNGGSGMFDPETGESTFIPDEYVGKIVIVDKYKNVDEVQKEIAKLGLRSQLYSGFYQGYIDLLTYGPLFASIILVLIFVIILESFLSKKIKYNSKSYAILKSIGYNKRTIKNINLLENIIILLLSLIVSVILYIVVFNYVVNVLYAEYIYDGAMLSFSIIPIIVTILLMLATLFFVNNKVLHKRLDKNLSEILL